MCTVKRFFKSTVMIEFVRDRTISHSCGTNQEPRTNFRCVEHQEGIEMTVFTTTTHLAFLSFSFIFS